MGLQRIEIIVCVETEFPDALECAEDSEVDAAVLINEQAVRKALGAAIKKFKAGPSSMHMTTTSLVVNNQTWDV